MKKVKTNKMKTCLKACLHGGGGPWVGEVTRLGGVTCLSIYSWLPKTWTLANSNLALAQTKIDFLWISVIHLL